MVDLQEVVELNTLSDIPADFHNTPIADLIAYHNFKQEFKSYTKAAMLIGMCMDHRKQLHIPQNFAYIIRTGGANLRFNEFKVSFAIAVGGVEHMALIGHTNCGMVNLAEKREQFIQGIQSRAGWNERQATEFFDANVDKFGIQNEVEFVSSEVERFTELFPKIKIAPLLYKVEDNLLYWIK